MIHKIGQIYEIESFAFQVEDLEPDTAVKVIPQLTDTEKVSEALRLARLIGSAIKTGVSGKKA